jgi:hypothetical protein
VEKGIYSLELFHGPTMAFKDVGARFMSRCLAYFNKDKKTVKTRFSWLLEILEVLSPADFWALRE